MSLNPTDELRSMSAAQMSRCLSPAFQQARREARLLPLNIDMFRDQLFMYCMGGEL